MFNFYISFGTLKKGSIFVETNGNNANQINKC